MPKSMMIYLSLWSLLVLFPGQSAAAEHRLRILNWEDYLSLEIVAEFEKLHNVKVDIFYYEHDEERDELLATRNGTGYDLVLVDGQSIPGYARLGWLSPLTAAEVPNLSLLSTWWQNYNPDAIGRVMPYGWGTYGIAYRVDLVEKPVTSFAQLFKPVSSLQGKIIMSPQALELVPVALQALGFSMMSHDPRELEAAEILLKSQKPYVYRYAALLLTEKSSLISGEAHAAMAYSGDAAALQALNENIRYAEAEEGQILWFDYWAVLASSTQKELAYQFLDYLQQPEVNARNAEAIYTATFNEKAMAYISEETKNNPAVFPTIQPNASYFVEPDTRHLRRIMSVWHDLNIR